MGQFQVGNQKRRSIRDHCLIVHAVVQEAIENNIQLDILFTDIKQCFDSIWLDEAINDLYLSGVETRNLNLLYEGNKMTKMCVESKFGRSDRAVLHNIVMQGSVSGGTLCSNQISKLCNKTFDEGAVYMYGNEIPIPALAMVDDLISFCKCCTTEAIDKNVKTDQFIKSKKLESQVGEGKCQWIHIGKSTCRSSYEASNSQITQCSQYKYLGDNVSYGWEILHKKRLDKATGYSITCQAMSTEISLGFQMFNIAKMLHQAIFLNGTLLNMETWPHFSNQKVTQYERIEQGLFRKVLAAHSKTPIECIYLELGVVPFRFNLITKRIMYYHEIMNRPDNEITKKVVLYQRKSNIKGSFYDQVSANMNELEISEEEILKMSHSTLKELVKKEVSKAAFTHLQTMARDHSKTRDEIYHNMEGQTYFHDPRFTDSDSKLLFKFRTRMYDVRNNFRNKYASTACPLCAADVDSQKHLIECAVIKTYYSTTMKYEDIFSDDDNILLHAALELGKITKIRNELTTNEQ